MVKTGLDETRIVVDKSSFCSCELSERGDTSWGLTQGSINSKTSLSIFSFMRHGLLSASSLLTRTERRNILKVVSRIIICSTFFTAILWTDFIRPSFASIETNFNSYKAINAILGEAEGEPYLGKVALGEALRNRLKLYGDFRGVYGLSSKRIQKASSKVREECEKAWRESGDSSLVDGASVWGTDSDVKRFKKTRWFRSYEFVCKIKNHSFYRLREERRNGVQKSKTCNHRIEPFSPGSSKRGVK
ncbi:MAG: hypothetical protein EOM12_03840 [Verrucomicrobiae bacterium]|nr:hypothetical protein [Verrucomicrobiae bacterium]